jgi:hypothetical protein
MIKLKEDASTLFFKSFFELEAKKDKAIKQGEWSKFAQEIEAAGIPKEELKENHLIAKQVIMRDVRPSSPGNHQARPNALFLRLPEQPDALRSHLVLRVDRQAVQQGTGRARAAAVCAPG